MSEALQEFVDSRSQRLRVDRTAGIIRGVKLLGLASRNGRRYRESALAEAAALYEGAKVNVNHPKGHPLAPRDYQDRLGEIRGVVFRAGDGLFGDLHFNPKHALSEQLVWDAEHAPQNVGLSHNVLARTTRDGDETTVEAITRVQSIDLVADPATTAGLFEAVSGTVAEGSSGGEQMSTRAVEQQGEPLVTPLLRYSTIPLATVTLDELALHRPDLVREVRGAQQVELQELRRQVEELTIRDAAATRRQRVLELIREHNLPLPAAGDSGDSPLVSAQFLETLMQAPDDASVRRLVEERAALVRSACEWNGRRQHLPSRPQSRQRLEFPFMSDDRPSDAKHFAAAIRGR